MPGCKAIVLIMILILSKSVCGQSDTEDYLNGDTLILVSGQKIHNGQNLIIGNPTGKNNSFRSIISSKAALVPSIWGQYKRYENAIENYVDSKRNKEKIKRLLVPGTLLTVKKILFSKKAKPHFYLVVLTSGDDKYSCDIKLALILKELIIIP